MSANEWYGVANVDVLELPIEALDIEDICLLSIKRNLSVFSNTYSRMNSIQNTKSQSAIKSEFKGHYPALPLHF